MGDDLLVLSSARLGVGALSARGFRSWLTHSVPLAFAQRGEVLMARPKAEIARLRQTLSLYCSSAVGEYGPKKSLPKLRR